MIRRLDHTDPKIAQNIRDVFQVSYTVEAELLKAIDFPPLQKTLDNFLKSENNFYGFLDNDKLIAVIEVHFESSCTHIQSLVVSPSYFRRGIAQNLIGHIFDNNKSELYTVETGKDNLPAIQLYQKFGFVKSKEYDTDHGVRKVRLEKKTKNKLEF